MSDPVAASPGSQSTSTTSTELYQYETFENFKHKALALAQNLGETDDVSVLRTRPSGDGFNRIIRARITKAGEIVDGIFRIPHFTKVRNDNNRSQSDENEEQPNIHRSTLDRAALLQMIASREDILAPALLAFDGSANNPIGLPNLFLDLAGGVALDFVWDEMTVDEKLGLVDFVVEFLFASKQIQFGATGTFLAVVNDDTPTRGCYQFDKADPELEFAITGFTIGHSNRFNTNTIFDSLPDFLSTVIDSSLSDEILCSGSEEVISMWKRLSDVLRDMLADDWFSILDCLPHSNSVLSHWDFEPKNIIVTRTQIPPGEAGAWRVPKFID